MMVIEWMNSLGWIVFSNTHCDVLEKTSSGVVDKLNQLQLQAEEDERLFLQEKERFRTVHKALESLAEGAKAIDANASRILPVLREREAAYTTHLQEIQHIAALALVPEEVTKLKIELDVSLQGLEEASLVLKRTFEKFEKRGGLCSF